MNLAAAASAAVQIGEQCPYCRRWVSPGELMKFGIDKTLKFCLKCNEKHLAALDAMAGNAPNECAECHVTFEQLSERASGEKVAMYAHSLEGMYVILCKPCSDYVEQLRRELYQGTAYGAQRGL